MTKWNFLGLLAILGGIVSVLFQAISSMMTEGDITWNSKTLVVLLGEGRFGWIDGIPVDFVQGVLQYLIHLQVFVLLIGTGVLLLIIGMLFNK